MLSIVFELTKMEIRSLVAPEKGHTFIREVKLVEDAEIENLKEK